MSKMNPENTMLQQSEGQWQKYLMLVLRKLAPGGVIITEKDIEEAVNAEDYHVFIHGHKDSIEFKLVTELEARRLAAHDRQQSGAGNN